MVYIRDLFRLVFLVLQKHFASSRWLEIRNRLVFGLTKT